MDLSKLDKILKDEPKYRLEQARSAVFQGFIDNWSEATSLSLKLREELNKKCPISTKAETFISKHEDVVKARITLEDELEIESVLLRHGDGRNTVCVSSQVGCRLSCKFCATSKMGYERDLQPFEIVEQVLFFARYLNKEEDRVSNVVFMGMGEPFLNYESVMGSIGILNDKRGLNIGARRISVSTVGITEGIRKLSGESFQVNLAVSLNAPNNRIRSRIIPANKEYPIEVILEEVDDYIKKTRRKVMFEYLLLEGINDSDNAASELVKLMDKPLYFLNLILCNPTEDCAPPSSERVKSFKSILKRAGTNFSQRYRFGEGIHAACGQLVVK